MVTKAQRLSKSFAPFTALRLDVLFQFKRSDALWGYSERRMLVEPSGSIGQANSLPYNFCWRVSIISMGALSCRAFLPTDFLIDFSVKIRVNQRLMH
jgi:hypothetical protein